MTKTGSGVRMNRPLCDPVDGKAHRCLPYWRVGNTIITMGGNVVRVSRKEMERMRQDGEGIITLHYGDVPDGEKVKRDHHRFVDKMETIYGEIRNQGYRKRVGDDE